MSFNYSPKIVTDGLVIYMDAANPKSYVSGATSWNDLSRNRVNTTFVSASTYNSSNLGCITFDGIDDYANIGPQTGFTMAPTNVTMLFWINGNYSGYTLGVFERTTVSSAGVTAFIPNNGWVQVGYSNSGSTNFFIINGVRYQSNTSARYVYDNGPTDKPIFSSANNLFGGPSSDNFCFQLQSISAGFGSAYTWNDFSYRLLGRSSTGTGISARFLSGNTANVMIYNRTLSQGDINQNYNAMKSRFGR